MVLDTTTRSPEAIIRVLVVGGTGMLGEPVARHLLAQGHTVRILTRRADAAAERFREPFDVVGGDVEDAGALGRAMASCDAPEAANKVFLVLGPEARTLEQALAIYIRECAPEAAVAKVPFGVLRILSWLPGKRELRRVGLPVMRYFAGAQELGSPDEANRLLGAPATTVEAWCQGRAGRTQTG